MEPKCDKLIMVAITSICIRRTKTPKILFQHSKNDNKKCYIKDAKPKKIYKLAKLIEMNSFNYDVKNKRCDLS